MTVTFRVRSENKIVTTGKMRVLFYIYYWQSLFEVIPPPSYRSCRYYMHWSPSSPLVYSTYAIVETVAIPLPQATSASANCVYFPLLVPLSHMVLLV